MESANFSTIVFFFLSKLAIARETKFIKKKKNLNMNH